MSNPDEAALNALRHIGPDPANWVPAHDGIDHNVVVVGGGQTGRTFSFALRRAGIGGVSVIDAAPDEPHAGVWLTRARMQKLRTFKVLPGPELGVTALGFQAWYEARHGAAAFDAIDRIGRTDWADYLRWFQTFLDIPVRYNTRLVRVEPGSGHLRLHLEVNGEPRVETTRKLVFGNGVVGAGGPALPAVLTGLPKAFYAHTSEDIDFTSLAGKTVGVLGSGASAFDAAAVALEHGAGAVHLFVRRAQIASVPIARTRGYTGAYDNYRHLPDAVRWGQAIRYREAGSAPPVDAINRAIAHANFHIHLASEWSEARIEGGSVIATAAGGEHRFDFVIAGTGYFADPNGRPELADFADRIALWRDRYTPPAGLEDRFFGAHPYLGFAHEYVEREPGFAPFLKDIHVYNPQGFVSFGFPTGDVPSIKRDVPLITAQISRDLFLADFDDHAERLVGPMGPDFEPDLYAGSVWSPQRARASVGG
ncbi:MAG TPA: SidA/IucD/PvdA family monooxygenase [Novosphingobium sp.]|nr:SidA/IucD/PvdA family monooxygenase [Novosphingobium sp.]